MSWCHEIFADVYGILCTGPAAPIALAEYLADDPQTIRQEQITEPTWGRYPTRHLRMLLSFELMRQLSLDDGGLETAWRKSYPAHQMDAFEDDLPDLVKALLGTSLVSFGGKALSEIVFFTADDQAYVNPLASKINSNGVLKRGESFRALSAALTVAYYTNPEQFTERDAGRALVRRLVKTIPPGVRGVGARLPADTSTADQALADDLLAMFS